MYLLLSILIGCTDRFETILPPGYVKPSPLGGKYSSKLFSLATKVDIGTLPGLFELRTNGLIIHPGQTNPSKVSFGFSKKYKKIILRVFISNLPPDALAIKEAGTVGVEFIFDGKSYGRILINRDSNLIKTIILTDTDVMSVIVDNDEGKPWFDWLMISAESLQ